MSTSSFHKGCKTYLFWPLMIYIQHSFILKTFVQIDNMQKNLSSRVCCSPCLPLVPINPRQHSEWLLSPAESLPFLVQSISKCIHSFNGTWSLKVWKVWSPCARCCDAYPSHLTIAAQESVETSEVTDYLLQSLPDHQSRQGFNCTHH